MHRVLTYERQVRCCRRDRPPSVSAKSSLTTCHHDGARRDTERCCAASQRPRIVDAS